MSYPAAYDRSCMGLFSVSDIAKTHHTSLIDDRHPRRRVLVALYGPPGAVLGGVGLAQWLVPDEIALGDGLSSSLAAAFGLIAGVLFSLSLTVVDKAIDMDLMGVAPGPDTERAALRLQGLAANTLFSSMIAGVATGFLIVGELIPNTIEIATALAVAAMVLVGTNGALVAGRVFSEAKWRTDRARTGESHRSWQLGSPGETRGPTSDQ